METIEYREYIEKYVDTEINKDGTICASRDRELRDMCKSLDIPYDSFLESMSLHGDFELALTEVISEKNESTFEIKRIYKEKIEELQPKYGVTSTITALKSENIRVIKDEYYRITEVAKKDAEVEKAIASIINACTMLLKKNNTTVAYQEVLNCIKKFVKDNNKFIPTSGLREISVILKLLRDKTDVTAKIVDSTGKITRTKLKCQQHMLYSKLRENNKKISELEGRLIQVNKLIVALGGSINTSSNKEASKYLAEVKDFNNLNNLSLLDTDIEYYLKDLRLAIEVEENRAKLIKAHFEREQIQSLIYGIRKIERILGSEYNGKLIRKNYSAEINNDYSDSINELKCLNELGKLLITINDSLDKSYAKRLKPVIDEALKQPNINAYDISRNTSILKLEFMRVLKLQKSDIKLKEREQRNAMSLESKANKQTLTEQRRNLICSKFSGCLDLSDIRGSLYNLSKFMYSSNEKISGLALKCAQLSEKTKINVDEAEKLINKLLEQLNSVYYVYVGDRVYNLDWLLSNIKIIDLAIFELNSTLAINNEMMGNLIIKLGASKAEKLSKTKYVDALARLCKNRKIRVPTMDELVYNYLKGRGDKSIYEVTLGIVDFPPDIRDNLVYNLACTAIYR